MRSILPTRILDFRDFSVIALNPHSVRSEPQQNNDIQEITEDDFGPFGETESAKARFRARFRNGHRVWILMDKEEAVAQDVLGGSSRRVAKWLIIEGEDGDIWSEFIDVVPSYRGRGLGPGLRRHVARECARAGVKRMLGLIDATNRNSYRALGKLGYVPIGRLRYLRILGLAVIRIGKTWRLGGWQAETPLQIPVSATAD
jgi:GNAT superfamily N-acetyltransferase